MPKKITSRPSVTTFRWRVEWRGVDGSASTNGYYRYKWVALLEARWRVLVTEGWRGDVILFDQNKGE
ncbi:hypothetical protein PBI_EGAD_58 [Arthrobacter phage Egad]|nr:hypothetical protein PBI_EGAD_58 [Arthrobacter phage Egad]QFG11799.1 hypothetical protein PBI_SALK_58 [Arthrobacter phage Salk]UVT31135.1 hypothetical protein PBI_LINDA_58 [Arthrobacter phage Linda]